MCLIRPLSWRGFAAGVSVLIWVVRSFPVAPIRSLISPYFLTQGREPLANTSVLSTNGDTYACRCARLGLTWERNAVHMAWPWPVASLYTFLIVMYLRMREAIFSISCCWVLHFAIYTIGTAVTCPLTAFGSLISLWLQPFMLRGEIRYWSSFANNLLPSIMNHIHFHQHQC